MQNHCPRFFSFILLQKFEKPYRSHLRNSITNNIHNDKFYTFNELFGKSNSVLIQNKNNNQTLKEHKPSFSNLPGRTIQINRKQI